MEAEKRPVGRPSSYSEEIADEICLRLSEGQSLRSICNDDHLPTRQTVLNWMKSNPDFFTKCACAREGQADWLHDDMADIEASVLEGRLDPQAARVVLSSKQWRAAKLAPKKYGDKQILEHSGPDGGAIKSETTITPDAAFFALAESMDRIGRTKAGSDHEAGGVAGDGEAGTASD